MNDSNHSHDSDVVERIYDAFDRGDYARALGLAQGTLVQLEEEDPVLRFLGGMALMELDRLAEAVDELTRAVELDPDDPEFGGTLALALFRACRFDDARQQAETALRHDPRSPEAHQVLGLLAERSADADDAREHFSIASSVDPERFPKPVRLSRDAFERQVAEAMDRLPETFRRHLDSVVVTVEQIPSDEILREDDPPLSPDQLLGLFVGLALGHEQTGSSGGELPPRILLFKNNLERLALDEEELREEIAVTVYHELGHYLGLDEDELERIDLG